MIPGLPPRRAASKGGVTWEKRMNFDFERRLISLITEARSIGLDKETIISDLEMRIADLRGEKHE